MDNEFELKYLVRALVEKGIYLIGLADTLGFVEQRLNQSVKSIRNKEFSDTKKRKESRKQKLTKELDKILTEGQMVNPSIIKSGPREIEISDRKSFKVISEDCQSIGCFCVCLPHLPIKPLNSNKDKKKWLKFLRNLVSYADTAFASGCALVGYWSGYQKMRLNQSNKRKKSKREAEENFQKIKKLIVDHDLNISRDLKVPKDLMREAQGITDRGERTITNTIKKIIEEEFKKV